MTTAAGVARPAGGGIAMAVMRFRELGILLALVLLIVGTAISNPRFLSTQSIRDLLLGSAILVILAVGQSLVIITRNVDLSVGSILGLTAFGTGALLVAQPGLPIFLVILVGMAFGAVLGTVNGGLVTLVRVPALVVTLGTLYVYRGLDYAWAGGRQINAADMPRPFLDFGTQRVAGVPVLALIALVVVVIVGWCLGNLRSGREFYAIGSDPAAAVLYGIRSSRRIMVAFVVNGALAGLAGVLYAARFGTLDATAGSGLELQVVAAAVVGGVAIFGGSGTVYGAAIGAVLLTTIGSSLAVLRVSPFWQQAVVGMLILGAITLDRLLATRVARRLQGSGPRGA